MGRKGGNGMPVAVVKAVLVLVFGVPIAMGCTAFLLGAMMMQIREEEMRDGKADKLHP